MNTPQKLLIAGVLGTSIALASIQGIKPSFTTIHLTWDASPDGKTYNLYVGNNPHEYTTCIHLGGVAKAVFKVPHNSETYYFAVTAVDGFLESEKSNEVFFRSP